MSLLSNGKNSSSISVNNKKANIFGNISLGIHDIPNLQNEINSIAGGTTLQTSLLGTNVIIDTSEYHLL